jgi:hypothetical protein
MGMSKTLEATKAGERTQTSRRRSRIPSGVMIKVIDVSVALKAALDHFNKHQAVDGKEPATSMITQTWGIVETPKGLFCLCTEGVGPDAITEKEPMQIDFQPEWKRTDGSRSIGWSGSTATLTKEDLLACPVVEEKPLEDFIRTFGARLEDNYNLWRRELSA